MLLIASLSSFACIGQALNEKAPGYWNGRGLKFCCVHPPPLLLVDRAVEMSGYLFKRPRGSRSSNIFKSWSRRWFILKTSKLVYQSESKEEVRPSVPL